MNTEKRLNHALKNASVLEFDDTDHLIFFSDVHRGDNSMSDEFAHNSNIYTFALQDYMSKGYHYIEIGDGDELWEHAKFKHIRSAHSDVFCILREFYLKNRLHILYGNHNMYLKDHTFVQKYYSRFYDEYYDVESELFPEINIPEAIKLVYKPTMQQFLVVHGHQGDLMNDQLWRISMFSLRYFWRFMHVVGFQNPSSPAKNRIKRHKIEVNFSKWIGKYRIPIICGHTHRPKFPKGNDLYYFNSGCCIHPRGITGIEITNGHIMLVDWRVKPGENGLLAISKSIIRGPEPLSKFVM